jgi:hypothetical protein
MSGRGEMPCARCKEFKRKDKLVNCGTFLNDNVWLCKHCKAVMIVHLKQLEQIALLADD